MRNLIEYPVTKEEILDHLHRLKTEAVVAERIGDMGPMLIEHSIEIIEAAFGLLDGFDRRGKEKGMGFVIPFPEATKLIQACNFDILSKGES